MEITSADPPRVRGGDRPAVYGHRGARGDVSENTVEGFLRAVDDGADGVELDVLLTADDRAVVWHDPVVDAAKVSPPDSPLVGRRVRDCPLAQLARLDVGSRRQAAFPDQALAPGSHMRPLVDVLTRLGEHAPEARVVVELKSDPVRAGGAAASDRERLVEAALTDVDAAGARGRVVLHSFDWAVLPLVARLAPDLPRSALAVPGDTFRAGSPWLPGGAFEDAGGDLVAAVAALGAHYVCPVHGAVRAPHPSGAGPAAPDVVDAAFVARAHAAGLAVVPWTVDHPDDLRDLARWGVDGVVVDHPGRAVRLLDGLAAGARRG